MSDFLERLNAAIDAAEQRARAAANARERISLDWPRTAGKSALMAFWNGDVPATVLRNIAEDRAVLAEHVRDELTPGPPVCGACSWWELGRGAEPVMAVPWPCGEALSVGRRHLITPEDA